MIKILSFNPIKKRLHYHFRIIKVELCKIKVMFQISAENYLLTLQGYYLNLLKLFKNTHVFMKDDPSKIYL
jgi:hypothetical protein